MTIKYSRDDRMLDHMVTDIKFLDDGWQTIRFNTPLSTKAERQCRKCGLWHDIELDSNVVWDEVRAIYRHATREECERAELRMVTNWKLHYMRILTAGLVSQMPTKVHSYEYHHDAPPALSECCKFWADQILVKGWYPHEYLKAGTSTLSVMYGVYMWEYEHILAPCLRWVDKSRKGKKSKK